MEKNLALINKIKQSFASDLQRTDELAAELISSNTPLIPEVCSHVISAGGKRLRPLLTLISAKLCNYRGEEHIKLAVAVEFIHTATLLHDDVIDNSKLRRGNKTANNIWGNEISILMGDFLLSRAFQQMVSTGSHEVLKILSDTSAIIAEGEIMQSLAEHDISTSQQHYLEIITAKTAKLFAAACKISGVISNIAGNKIEHLYSYGKNLGIAFQIVDDLLDYSAEQEALGKTIGKDFQDGKITLPLIFAYARADKEEKLFLERAVSGEEQYDDDLKTALAIIEKYDIESEISFFVGSYAEKAKRDLDIFPDSPEKEALTDLADFAINRVC